MKSYLSHLLQQSPDPHHAKNLVREYLQARILESLQKSGAMVPLAFHGGTALRFLYAIPRYSEDLDFTLEQRTDLYDFHEYLRTIQNTFRREGFDVSIKLNDSKVVHSAFIRFDGLLYELGISPHQTEIISIKIEVDTNPPTGAVLRTTVVRRQVMLNLHHHDPASLLAGKLHAILQRPYTKGRDIFDLLWYLSDPDWAAPNLTLLNHALAQTGWTGQLPLTEKTWRLAIAEKLQQLDWRRVQSDVQPFLEATATTSNLTPDTLLRLVGN